MSRRIWPRQGPRLATVALAAAIVSSAVIGGAPALRTTPSLSSERSSEQLSEQSPGQPSGQPSGQASSASPSPAAATPRDRGRPLIVIAVVDGLRPDSISAEDTPTLARLRREGVRYTHSHAAFPTVTRVNGATLVTGVHPARHGLVSNTMYVPAVDPAKPFSTGDWQQLVRLRDASGGRLLFTKTLGEILQAHGLTFVAASSGSTGSGFVLNSRATDGVGVLVSGRMEPGRRVAFPDPINDAILRRFGAAPEGEGRASLDWTERVLREYVLPEIKPDVLLTWLTEPDGAQHAYGVGSPEARAGLRNSDRNLGLLLEAIDRQMNTPSYNSPAVNLPGANLPAASRRAVNVPAVNVPAVNVIVTSDHGFARHGRAVNITQALVRAGLKASVVSDDVIVVSNGQSVLLHVQGRDAQKIQRVVRFLQEQQDVDLIFTRARAPGSGPPASRAAESAPVGSDPAGSAPAGPASARQAARQAPAGSVGSRSRAPRGLPVEGAVPGTFALELVHAVNDARGADIIFTFGWSSAANRFGVSGTQTVHSDMREGPLDGEAAGHGGLSPWVARNTLILWGPAFRRGLELDTPAGTVDITPTVLALLGVDAGPEGTFDGRVLQEALGRGVGGPRRGAGAGGGRPWQETLKVSSGGYAATLRVSGVGDRWYVDEGARVRD